MFRDFYQLRTVVSNIIHQAKCEYFTNTLLEHKHQPREIFRICNRLLGRNKDLPLPPSYTDEELATKFNNFFTTEIANIREVLESTCIDTIQTDKSCTHMPPKLTTFKVLTCQDVEKIISRLLSKSSEADPTPTSQVVLKHRKYYRVTEPMSTLHWLCIHERIQYKVASIKFNCLKSNAPQYLIDLLPKRQNIRQL